MNLHSGAGTGSGVCANFLMLRIQRSASGRVVFAVSGRMQTEYVDQFQQLLIAEPPGQSLTLDLRHLTLVNQDAVTFLAGCEAKGIKVEGCPPYLRNWIDQEKRRNKKRGKQIKEAN